MMQWVAIPSSTLAAVCYLPDQSLLPVQFRSGDLYAYFDVPQRVYAELLAAPSKGRYFNVSVRSRFRCQPFGRASAAGEAP